MQSQAVSGLPITQYVYDAEGARIAKTTISAAPASSTNLCAAPLAAGYTLTARYLVDLGGDQVTELNTQSGTTAVPLGWAHSNVFSAARLTATYDTKGLHYELADPLGTKRVQANISGVVEMSWASLPFGDALTPISPTNPPSTSDDATEHHFTGKERDTESGNDYFEARYYSSSVGRFLSVDPVWVKADRILDPQRLNLYSYSRNNPLKFIDPSGMDTTLGCSGNRTMTECFHDVQLGLKAEDRGSVHLVEGNGENGFKKGEYGITVDPGHKSDSNNFNNLQNASNDHNDMVKINVVGEGVTFNFGLFASFNGRSTRVGNAVDKISGNLPFDGNTFYQFRGNARDGITWSAGRYTMIVANGNLDDIELSATIYHELEHVILGDFGRMAQAGAHSPTFHNDNIPHNNADFKTLAAEAEARTNAKQ